MSVGDIVPRARDFVNNHRHHLWTTACLALIGWSAYNLGIIYGHTGGAPLQEAAVFRMREGNSPQTSLQPTTETGSPKPAVQHTDPRVVVSKKSSSKKYHFSWCSGAITIKTENQLWFPTAAAAQVAGYTLAANCTQ